MKKKIWASTKSLIGNRKKKRAKKAERFPDPFYTDAQKLIDNQFGIVYSNPEPERAGEKRASERLRLKRKQNKSIPDTSRVTRQQMRRNDIFQFKEMRSAVNAQRRKNRREALAAPGSLPV